MEENRDVLIGDPRDYYLTQRDNNLHPHYTCFPTSVAMVISYILKLSNISKKDIGIDEDMQIEDYLTSMSMKASIINWMTKYVGSWTRAYIQKAWLVAKVQEKMFDDLMNKIGYDAEFLEVVRYDEICQILDETKIPQVGFGDFKKTSSVRGHITCLTGFNKAKKQLIVNDPYGNAYTAYKDHNGAMCKYNFNDFYVKGYSKKLKENYGWLLAIHKK